MRISLDAAPGTGLLLSLLLLPWMACRESVPEVVSRHGPIDDTLSESRLSPDASDDRWDRELADAQAALLEAIESEPDSPQPHLELGRFLLRHGRSRRALEAFRSARRLEPRNAEILFEEGQALGRLGRSAAARAAWRTALELDPNHGPSHARLAVDRYWEGDSLGAHRHLAAAKAAGVETPAALSFLLGATDLPSLTVRSPGPEERPLLGPPVRVDGAPPGAQAAETSIAASPSGELLATWGDTRSHPDSGIWRIGYAWSPDGGRTWNESILRSSVPRNAETFEADPMTAYDPRSGSFWAGGISFAEEPVIFLARKGVGSAGLEPSVRARIGGSRTDKGFLAAGPAPGDPDATRLYLVDRTGLQVSKDLGESWSEPVAVGDLFGALPRVGPDGTLYVTFWNGLSGIQLLRSLDGGLSIEDRTFVARRLDLWDSLDGSRFPGLFRVPPLPYFALDPVTGTLYCIYFDTRTTTAFPNGKERDVDLFFTRSDDGGRTWLAPRPIPFGNGEGDQFLPWLEVDAMGRLHLVFYDTRSLHRASPAPVDADPNARVDVYYAWSADRGESWTEIRLTDEPFETGDIAWKAPEGQFLGDYLGLAVAGGVAHPLYAVARDGDLDVFTRALDFGAAEPSTGPPPVPDLEAVPSGETGVRLSWTPQTPGSTLEIRMLSPVDPLRTLPLARGDAGTRTIDGLAPGRPYTFSARARSVGGASEWSTEASATLQTGIPDRCVPDLETLCLLDGRYSVRAIWRVPEGGGPGTGRPRPLVLPDGSRSANTGTFWFFDPDNVELVVKVLDAGSVNGFSWVFFGALTNVEYWLIVTDTHTGASRTYHNPFGELCGLGDTRAFPLDVGTQAAGLGGHGAGPSGRAPAPPAGIDTALRPQAAPGAIELCDAGETELCLRGRRFAARVEWRDPRTGQRGVGHAIPGGRDSGFFWFFEPDNVELVVKVLNGLAINGRQWVFYGGLSDVEYTLTIRDAFNNETRTYRNEAFNICGGADTAAF